MGNTGAPPVSPPELIQMSSLYSGLRETGQAEIGYDPDDGEVFLKHAGEKYWMQPDEARQMANLLMQSAEAAEGGSDDGDLVEFNPEDHEPIGDCEICGDPVYPASPDQIGARAPVMHEGCGW